MSRIGRPPRPAEERFFAKVRQVGDCWVWQGTTNNGYGHFRSTSSTRSYAHRWSYENLVAEIPPGLTLDHLCRNRACVNPNHLEPVPGVVNTLRGTAPSAANAVKTHCKRGHEFTPENTRQVKGGRACRTCTNEASRASKKRSAA